MGFFCTSPQKGSIQSPGNTECPSDKILNHREELDRYNNHQVHSTTGEIPRIRFERALTEGNSLLRPLSLPKPYTSLDDVFCLREQRRVNSYSRISLFSHEIQVPNTPLHKLVDIHMIPDQEKSTMNIRIWWNDALVHTLDLPLDGFRVQFSAASNR